MAQYKVTFKGIDEVRRHLGANSASKMKRQIDEDLSEGIRDMADNSAEKAPVDTGALRSSILASVRKLSRHHYMYGSTMPYAQRQNYEHQTKKYYFERAVNEEAPEIKDKIVITIKRHLNA